MKLFHIFLFIPFFLSGCKTDGDWDQYNFKSFISKYYFIEDISYNQQDSRCIVVKNTKNVFYSQFNKADEEKFNSISLKNNDLNYNSKFKRLRGENSFCSSYSLNLLSIKVFSLGDYNSTHVAGSSLEDIVRFLSLSLKKFVSSGYKETFVSDGNNLNVTYKKYLGDYYSKYALDYPQFRADGSNNIKPYFPVDCLIKDLKTEDLNLILYQSNSFGAYSTLGYLYFEELPDVPGNYNIKVEITDENGKIYSSTITMMFDF